MIGLICYITFFSFPFLLQLVIKKSEVECSIHHPAAKSMDRFLVGQGKYQIRPKFPFAPGGEIAGVISAIGEGCTR